MMKRRILAAGLLCLMLAGCGSHSAGETSSLESNNGDTAEEMLSVLEAPVTPTESTETPVEMPVETPVESETPEAETATAQTATTSAPTTAAPATTNSAPAQSSSAPAKSTTTTAAPKPAASASSSSSSSSAAASAPTDASPAPAPAAPQPVEEPAAPVSVYKDGTFSGSATGYNGNISVSVTISGDKITGISVTSSSDDEPFLTDAKGVISHMLSAQSANVSAVSGATYSSNGIINAVKAALSSAKN